MKLDCVLTAVNDNPLYLEFIPIFINTWNKLYPNVDVKIILISNKIPELYMDYKDNIILFEPIESVITSFTSQYIRLLYPCILNYKNGVMITDIDILPMNRTYYTEHIKQIDNDKFIYLRDKVCFECNQIAMCYNIATPDIWRDVFGINSIDDIKNIIYNIYKNNDIKEGHGNSGWSIDQQDLYKRVMYWNDKTHNLVCISEDITKFNRLDRSKFFDINDDYIRKNIINGLYSDYHCYRPMSIYSDINYDIYNLL